MSKEGQYMRWYSVREHLPGMTKLNIDGHTNTSSESPRLPVMVEGVEDIRFATYHTYPSGRKVWNIEGCHGDFRVTQWFPLYIPSAIAMTIDPVPLEEASQ